MTSKTTGSKQFFGLLISFIGIVLQLAPVYSHAAEDADRQPSVRAATIATDSLTAGTKTERAVRSKAEAAYARLPLSFEANHGQASPEVKFISRAEGFNLLLTSGEAVLAMSDARVSDLRLSNNGKTGSLRGPEDSQSQVRNSKGAIVRMKIEGRNASSELEGVDPVAGRSNYFVGSDPAKWRTNISNYASVRQKNVYTGIDLVYYGNEGGLEYDFKVAPGADFTAITLGFEGVEQTSISASGDLILTTRGGSIIQKKPFIYQQERGARKEVAGRYTLKGKHKVGFEIPAYDKTRMLVIDPEIIYSTYFGGSKINLVDAIATNSAGDTFVAGSTNSPDFPTTPGTLKPDCGCTPDVPFSPVFAAGFIARFDPAGQLIYSTFIGGGGPKAIVADDSGNVYIVGSGGKDLPTTPGAYQRNVKALESETGDAFVMKLSPTGLLIYSTFLGGSGIEEGNAIARDGAGNIYITGNTYSADFPIVNGFRTEFIHRICPPGKKNCVARIDGFMSKLNADGSALVYSTFIGGLDLDVAGAIAVDSAGNAYVGGATSSADFPVRRAFQSSISQHRPDYVNREDFDGPLLMRDSFLVKIDPSKSGDASLVYSTFLGGNGLDGMTGIAIDRAGLVYVTANTNSTNFPVKNALQSVSKNIEDNRMDVYLAKFDTSKSGAESLVYATYLSGQRDDFVKAIALDESGNAYLTGYSASLDFPIVNAMFAGGALLKSGNGASSFTASSTGLSVDEINVLAIDPKSSSVIYAGDYGFGLFKSADGGNSWSRLNSTPSISLTKALTIDPKSPETLYAGTINDNSLSPRLYKSTNQGATWSAIGPVLASHAVNDIVIDPQNTSVVYAAMSNSSRNGGVYKSTNSGATWARSSAGLDANISSLAVNPNNPSTLYAGTVNGLFTSTDGGASWSATSVSGFVKAIEVDPNGAVYLSVVEASFGLAFIDPDGRGNPRKRITGPQIESELSVTGLLKSSDGGKTWRSINKGLPDFPSIYQIAVDPQLPSLVYIASETGVYKSANGGEDWARGGISNSAQAIALDPKSTSTIYVGSEFYEDNFLAKISADGSRLLYSSFGGGNAVAVDLSDNVYIGGFVYSRDTFSLKNAFQTSPRGMPAFVAKINVSSPRVKIASVTMSGKKLVVTGENFSAGAVIMLSGKEYPTSNDADSPSTRLISKKAGKKIKDGDNVMIQIKNADGATSNEFMFIRR